MDDTLLPAIQARYACRSFLQDAVPHERIAVILEAGRLAPSGFGLEPWRFVVVSDDVARKDVAQACYGQLPAVTAPVLVVIVARADQLDPDSDYVHARFETEARGQPMEPIVAGYRAFYQADSIVAWAIGQCNFAAAQMLLQAAHLGLASCPIGGFEGQQLAHILGLSEGEVPALVVALGRCAHGQPERHRKPLD